ncbi:MAG: peptidoglycan-binding protein [Novosphingobium sp.]|nr:peptidoglycan-binding protein [Novosphingobium sp.]
MLKSQLLSGNARLESAAVSPPSIRKRPPDDDADAVRRIQKALVRLGFTLPKSFPNGPALEPDGLFGPETEGAVKSFQKREFPGAFSEWDGRVGPKTLAKMDGLLGPVAPERPVHMLLRNVSCTSNCKHTIPGNSQGSGPGIAALKPGMARSAISPARR